MSYTEKSLYISWAVGVVSYFAMVWYERLWDYIERTKMLKRCDIQSKE